MAKHLSDGPLVCVGFWLPQTALMSASSPALGRRGGSSRELERERALLDRPKPAVPCSWCPASLILAIRHERDRAPRRSWGDHGSSKERLCAGGGGGRGAAGGLPGGDGAP